MAKVMISLPDEFLKKIDRAARAQGRSRSELIREAVRATLGNKAGQPRCWKGVLAPLRDLEEQWVGHWDSSDIIRYYPHTRHGFENRR